MVRGMHFAMAGSPYREGEMNEERHFRTAVCSAYTRLLQECQSALVAWKERSEQISRLALQGKRTGDDLRRLQAEYARAYNRLERHAKSCNECRFTSDFTQSGDASPKGVSAH